MKDGFVYAVRCADRIKIGFSVKPKFRFSKIASDSPFPCEWLGAWPGTREDEARIHKEFSSLRLHREWFEAAGELLSFIKRYSIDDCSVHGVLAIKETDGPVAVWRKTNFKCNQADFAEIVGVTQPTVSCWERSKQFPNWRAIKRIRNAALERGIPWEDEWFLTGEATPQ